MSAGGPLDPLALIARISQEEKKLSEMLFLAPVVAGGKVRVRVSGVVYDMQVADRSFEGFALLRATTPGRAAIAGLPTLAQIERYLKLMPRLRLVLVDRYQERFFAIQASGADKKIKLAGPVAICAVEAGAAFNTIYARFDGAHFWYETADRRRDPSIARQLRQALAGDLPPDQLHVKSVVPQERLAYTMLWLQKHPDSKPAGMAKTQEETLQEALAHAGAELDAYWNYDHDATTVVRFLVNGQTHTANINRHDLTLYSAGVCLQGQDMDFDLTSLVGVLEEYSRG